MDVRPETVEVVGTSDRRSRRRDLGRRPSARRLSPFWTACRTTLGRVSRPRPGHSLRLSRPASRGVDARRPGGGLCTEREDDSMIAAAAMGRDNGFGLVVFIAGTSDILLGQSRQRLDPAFAWASRTHIAVGSSFQPEAGHRGLDSPGGRAPGLARWSGRSFDGARHRYEAAQAS